MKNTVSSADQNSTTTELGSEVAALLEQVPADLAAKLRDAIGDDLIAMHEIGLRMGRHNARSAMQANGFTFELKPTAPAKPKRHLSLVGGAA